MKGNQPEQYAEMARCWATRDPTRPAVETTDLVGGRVETRRLWCFPQLAGWLDWPHLAQGVGVERFVQHKTGGAPTREVCFALTSLPPDTEPFRLLTLLRDHWSIENRVHHVLDATLGEDACRVRAGYGAALLAVLRRLALGLLQTIKGHRSLPTLMRYLNANGRLLRLCLGKSEN